MAQVALVMLGFLDIIAYSAFNYRTILLTSNDNPVIIQPALPRQNLLGHNHILIPNFPARQRGIRIGESAQDVW
jgi:hypothetical protein